jgi:hypothetical protein
LHITINEKTRIMEAELNTERQIVADEISNLKIMIAELSKYDSISAQFQAEDFTQILNAKIEYRKTLY